MDAAAIIAEARSWLGTPFVHQGAVKGAGCDCIGLVVGVAHACGIVDARSSARDTAYNGYGRSPRPELLQRACDEYLEPVAELEPAAVLLMRFARHPQHVALVSAIAPAYIIHAYAQAGRVVEHGLDRTWQRRIVRAYRFRSWQA